jgi:hypothetical protein
LARCKCPTCIVPRIRDASTDLVVLFGSAHPRQFTPVPLTGAMWVMPTPKILERGQNCSPHEPVQSKHFCGSPIKGWQGIRVVRHMAKVADGLSQCPTISALGGEQLANSGEQSQPSTQLTMDVYSHVLPGMQEEATAQLERMLYGLGTLRHTKRL